jgi:ABC transporter transmembrane region
VSQVRSALLDYSPYFTSGLGTEGTTTGDQNALWFFIAAICAAIATVAQQYALIKAAADLTAKLRTMIFQATLRQDSK